MMELFPPAETRQRPISLILGRDREVIPVLLELHAPHAVDILDATYNAGVMWKGSGFGPTVTNDLDPDVSADHHYDCRDLGFTDSTFDVIAFDPPHLPAAAASANSSGIERRQYGLTGAEDWMQADNVEALFLPFLVEAKRVLRDQGIVLAKIADLVHNHAYQWQHVGFINACRAAGLTPCDVIVKGDPCASNLKSSKWVNVRHVRRAHCFWIVARKGKCETKGVAA